MQNSSGSEIYCREELLSLGARASRPHKTWQGRGDWLHRVGRFTRRLTLEQRLDKYAGGTPALPGGNPWLARCRSLSRALFCRSILPPSHARLQILQKAQRVYFQQLVGPIVMPCGYTRCWACSGLSFFPQRAHARSNVVTGSLERSDRYALRSRARAEGKIPAP